MFLTQKLGEWLYRYAYPLYRPLYFTYKRIMEENEISFFKKNIRNSDIVLDIGANIGFYSLLFSELIGQNGKVYAFEPEKNNFNRLVQNTKNRSNIHCIHAAVSDISGQIYLYSSEFGLNVDYRTYYSGNNQMLQTVKAYSIDDFAQTHNIQKVDWIKIDIQGYEYFAFKGMKEIVSKNKDIKIITEFWPYGINKAGITVKDWFDLIYSINLHVFTIKNHQIIPFDLSSLPAVSKYAPSQYYNLLLTH